MKSIREILRLAHSCKLSGRQIAKSLGLSRSAVWECLRRSIAANLSWPLPVELDEDTLNAMLYPPQEKDAPPRPMPDCQYIHKELKRKGVTLSLLWEEHKNENPAGYQYTQFCEIYRNWLKKVGLVMRQEHKAGKNSFSDFSGGTLKVIDRSTGEVEFFRLFVCALGASSYTYAELFPSESAESWCNGQANAFKFFGGTTEFVVPDNPRAVITKADYCEPEVNPDFLLLAQHFDIAVAPARVRRPKDKAKVESAVGVATRWILARLRNQDFFTLAEANQAVQALLSDLNNRPFQKMKGSRRSLYEEIDKPALKALPRSKYEYMHVEFAKAGNDYHVNIDGSHYSVPFYLVGERLEVRICSSTIEVFHKGTRVASHPKCNKEGQTQRLDEHMPPAHRAYKDWSADRFQEWAAKIGPSTALFVNRLIAQKRYPELAYRACFALMRLVKGHGSDRMEGASQRAIAVGSYSYTTVKLILQNRMDCRPLPVAEMPEQLTISNNNVRGSEYYTSTKGE
jgi:transposase